MNRFPGLALTSLALMLLYGCMAPAQNKNVKQSPTTANQVSGRGVVEAGVEAGCLVLQDSSTKEFSNLIFPAANRPAVGSAISFTGVIHEGPTACMQGKAIDVKKWAPQKKKGSGNTGKGSTGT